MKLNLVACNSNGVLTFDFGEHRITANVNYMRKWRSQTIDRKSTQATDINNQMEYWGKLIHRGAKRNGK